jgi:hypothetical protein
MASTATPRHKPLIHDEHPGHVHLGTSVAHDQHAAPPLGALARAIAPELADCSAPERDHVWRSRMVTVVEAWAGGITGVAGFELLNELAGGDSVLVTAHNAANSSINALLGTFISPIVCSLSDAHGWSRRGL